MKKCLALALAMAMTLSLAACGAKEEPAASSPAVSAPAVSAPAASTPAAPVEDEVWSSTDAEGNVSVIGYYVVYFVGSNTNEFALANVRHILIAPQGGTYDSTTGTTVYSDEEKAAAKATAEELYAQWKAGEATEDTFATLANEKSADGDGTTGGLYTDVYPGQMVANFNDWCFAEGRKAGDTGIVETEYGCHIMFYVGNSNTTYRDYLITNDLTTADANAWFNGLVENMTVTTLDTKYIRTDLVLG